MTHPPLVLRLLEALRRLPGVGPKSAQRMAFHLLERDREGALRLSLALQEALEGVGRCRRCHNLSEGELCPICSNERRDGQVVCVVESPADVQALEQSTGFQGRYFVLGGHLSPLDGVGPDELGLEQLAAQVAEGEVQEVIIATNPTVEGEATAHYISELLAASGARITRLAHGVPLGGELEYVDSGTLSRAFHGRREVQ